MIQVVRKFSALDWDDRWLYCQLTALLPLVALGLASVGFKRVYAALAQWAGLAAAAAPADEAADLQRVRYWARDARRHFFCGNCLSRSLVLWWWLQRRGVDVELRIGARKGAGDLQAHAWLERGGRAINAGRRVRQRYAAFDHLFVPAGR